jgi:F-type H+-transporting ATPase subunit gamma
VATLEELRSQLESAHQLHGVVKTMKALAAVNLRQFQRAATSLAQFHRTVEMGLKVLLEERPMADVGESADSAPTAIVLLGSDQGMVGGFNERIVEHTLRRLNDPDRPDSEKLVLIMGTQAATIAAAWGYPPDERLPVPGTPTAITDTAEQILVILDRWRTEHGAQRMLVFHNEVSRGASYTPRDRQLLPLDPAWLHELQTKPWPNHVVPTYFGEWREQLRWLVRSHLFAQLFEAIAISVAAENAARVAAMESAERNIDERIDDLTAAERSQRQQAITSELLDIVAGFEALGE